jgi:hypothetical protein
MDPEARDSLMRALRTLEKSTDALADPLEKHRRLRFLTFLLASCVCLIPWIVVMRTDD